MSNLKRIANSLLKIADQKSGMVFVFLHHKDGGQHILRGPKAKMLYEALKSHRAEPLIQEMERQGYDGFMPENLSGDPIGFDNLQPEDMEH